MNQLQRLHEIFDALLDVPAERREDWLNDHQIDMDTRSELQRLAEEDAQTGPLDRSPAATLATAFGNKEPTIDSVIGRRIGVFRIVRALGEGGMASVFLAQREGADFQQTVALKLLKRGALSDLDQAFFRRERQVLARLSHPGIARLIDGGVSEDGIAYLAMEYVDGVAITEWCRARSLSIEARVALVCKVARAAAAAHAALVVHRDIKPSNVLVTAAGEPMLLDFGIAKILRDEDGETTRTGVVPMTPQYASPEQWQGGAITTATDVYALGLLLFEVLTGRRANQNARQLPAATAAARLETRERIDRDLHRVLQMALTEEPRLRYPGAEAMADDLERYLSHQPVRAHPPSAWYRTRKFVERHRVSMAVSFLLILGLFASLAYSLWQARQAQAQAARAEQVSTFLIELFEAAGQSLPRQQRPTPASIVREARASLEGEAALDPATRASLLVTLANVSRLAGEYETALALADQAQALLGPDTAHEPRTRRQALLQRAQALRALGRAPEAKSLLAPLHAQFVAGRDELAVEGLATLAALEAETGALETAVLRARETASLAEQQHGSGSREALRMQMGLGDMLGLAGKQAESISVLEASLSRWREVGLPLDRHYVNTLMSLASARVNAGELVIAERETRQVLALLREIHDGPHDAVAQALQNLGGILSISGRIEEARPHIEEAARMFEALLGPNHMQVASAWDAMASVHMDRREFAAAAQTLERVTRICVEGGHENSDPACGRAWQNLSYAYLMQNRLEDAARANERSRDARRALHGESSPQFAATLSGLAGIRMRQQRYAEALELVQRGIALLDQAGHGDAPAATTMHATRARCLRETGQTVAALAALERAEALWQKNMPADRERELRLLLTRLDILIDLARTADARAVARAVLAGGFAADMLDEVSWKRINEAAR